MSEIKGQLLGMILVILVFSAISATVVGMFNTEVGNVSSQFNSALAA